MGNNRVCVAMCQARKDVKKEGEKQKGNLNEGPLRGMEAQALHICASLTFLWSFLAWHISTNNSKPEGSYLLVAFLKLTFGHLFPSYAEAHLYLCHVYLFAQCLKAFKSQALCFFFPLSNIALGENIVTDGDWLICDYTISYRGQQIFRISNRWLRAHFLSFWLKWFWLKISGQLFTRNVIKWDQMLHTPYALMYNSCCCSSLYVCSQATAG